MSAFTDDHRRAVAFSHGNQRLERLSYRIGSLYSNTSICYSTDAVLKSTALPGVSPFGLWCYDGLRTTNLTHHDCC